MSSIFNLDNTENFSEKLNIDDLYEKKKQQDLNKLELFNKILNRVHVKIKNISKMKTNEQFCWYLVPEIILGVPKFDQASCIAYLIDKLQNSGFNVKYYHPNLLFICWAHWIPSYVRMEIKKRTGINIDQFGNKIESNENKDDELEYNNNNNILLNNKENISKDKKEYKSIKSYKPSGNLVYDNDLINKLENKFKS